MKHKILSIIAAAAAVLGAAACTDLLEQDKPVEIAMSIAVQPDSLEVKAEGDAVSFTFNAPDYWFASCPADWVTIDPASGKPGDATITVKAAQNTGLARSAMVTVTSKTQRGQFKIKQAAWPYSASAWSLSGTINGGSAVAMADQGDGLVWKAAKVAFHAGEAFKLKMGTVTLGLEGALSVADAAYIGKVKKDGSNIVLPENGYWDITLDLNNWTITAELADRFNWTMVGTINGSDWTEDFAMAADDAKLVWTATKIAYNPGEEFKFRMDGLDAFSLGLDGALAADAEAEDTFNGNLKSDGANITLPEEGYWTLTLNLNDNTLKAVLVERFPQVHEGVYWENDDPEGHGGVSWNGVYRFGLKGNDGNNECITTFPEEVWTKIKTKPFYLVFAPAGDWYQVQVTDGWWSANWNVIQPGNELLKDNGDGTLTLKIDFSGNADFVAGLDQKHLLFTGEGYTPLGLYPENTWENDDPEGHGAVSWSGQYRFGLEGNDGNNECITTFPQSIWDKLKTSTFYLTFAPGGDWYQVQVTTGWWSSNWKVLQPGDELLVDNGDGTLTATINVSDNADFVSLLDAQHLLFTGEGYTPLKIQLIR